ncbi:protein I'm not dead yet-like [Aphomia sociella]
MIVVAIEQSRVHRRLALKLLLTIGYSHYKLSFFLFFSTMCLSMWFSNIVACGLMMPLVKAILDELEKMGILDMYQTIEKSKQAISRRPSNSRPTDVTVFYFLGVAYSSSIGAMATIIGSQSNQILKRYCETIFPLAPKIEFPHFMLLNLPGVLLMETLLYLWMNAFFLGMFSQIQTSAPCILSALLLFLLPVNLNFMKFFRKRNENNVEPLPNSPSNACLNWSLVKDNIHWSVLIITGGSCFAFEALKDSGMTDEMGKLLLTFKTWPQPALLLAVIVFCKMLTEFASNSCVAYCLLPSIARLGVASNINPHYLMVAGTLSCGLPFHLMTGSPVNAMVAAYVNISPWKMMRGGIGLSVLGVVVTWCTVVLWSKAIWADINSDPEWADVNTLNNI